MSNLDHKAVIEQEVARLKKVHPTAEDIPSCISLFELITSCHGPSFPAFFLPAFPTLSSHPLPGQIVVQIRRHA